MCEITRDAGMLFMKPGDRSESAVRTVQGVCVSAANLLYMERLNVQSCYYPGGVLFCNTTIRMHVYWLNL